MCLKITKINNFVKRQEWTDGGYPKKLVKQIRWNDICKYVYCVDLKKTGLGNHSHDSGSIFNICVIFINNFIFLIYWKRNLVSKFFFYYF